jgi:hypothetical protein
LISPATVFVALITLYIIAQRQRKVNNKWRSFTLYFGLVIDNNLTTKKSVEEIYILTLRKTKYMSGIYKRAFSLYVDGIKNTRDIIALS